tara:strand:- start:129 stop:641 length:513 start_codon:yes stop_codon:yes gene_type:complete
MVAGLFFVICEVLVISGVGKILSPKPTESALSTVGLPSSPSVVRALGITEILLGVSGVVMGGQYIPIAVGVLFALFAVFIIFVIRHDDLATCGCFGAMNEPPTLLHASANIIFMVIALTAIGIDGISEVIDRQWASGIPFIISVLLGALAIYLCLVFLPRFWRGVVSNSR